MVLRPKIQLMSRRTGTTCRNCPSKDELVVVVKQLASVRTSAIVFEKAVISLLSKHGFHTSDKLDALSCIKNLCESINAMETHLAEGDIHSES